MSKTQTDEHAGKERSGSELVDTLKSRREQIWHLVRWYVVQMWEHFFTRECLNAAAALTYTTLFAVVPMMTVTYTFFSLIPEYAQVGEQLQSFVFQNFVPASSDLVQTKLAEFADRARNLTAVGFIFLFVTSFMMLVTIEKSFNSIWEVKEPRRGLQRFLVYWGVLSLGPASVVIGLLSSLYLLSLPLVSEIDAFGIREILLGYLPGILSVLFFTILYYSVPNCVVPFKHALAGGVVTMAVFQIAFNLFASSSRSLSYDALYGTFAAVPIFLLWLYFVWVIVLSGAIFVRCLSLLREDEGNVEPLVIKAVRILELFHQAHLQGHAISDTEINKSVHLNRGERERVFAVFQSHNLLIQTENERWVLGRNLKAVTLWDLYQQLPEGMVLEKLNLVQGMPQIVEPLKAITKFGSNEMNVSLDTIFSSI